MPNDWNPVTYNSSTRQLDTVPDSFNSQNLSVLSIAYNPGIDAGANIGPGDEFAIVQWEDNSREALAAPDNCSGTIAAVNRNIAFENLSFEPSQWLLILAAE